MATASPRIVSRGDWGANPLNTPAGNIAIPTPNLWLHHTANHSLHGASGMRSLQSYARSNGYVDLEYSVCVDTDGQIYMSRGIGKDSAATGGNNSTSHAVCAMGYFHPPYNDPVTSALMDGIASAVLWLKAQGAIQQARITGPHRAAPGNSTACCGDGLVAKIPDIQRIIDGGGGPAPQPPEEDDPMDLASATNHDARPVVFQVGGDAKLYYRIRNASGGGWPTWKDLSGGKTGFATVTAFQTPFKNTTKIEVWVTMKDGKTFNRWQTDDLAGWEAWQDKTR